MLTIIDSGNLEYLEQQHPRLETFERLYVLHQNEHFAYLPRHFITSFPSNKYKVFNDPLFQEQLIDLEFTGTLRDTQIEGAEFLLNKYNTDGYIGGIFEALVGHGKTCIATYLASKIQKKTLIVLDNSKLMDQWIEAFLKYTNIKEENIGIIKSSKIQLDKPVTICMVQTLMSKVKRNLKDFYPIFRSAGFGFVVFDEVHKTSSGPRYATSTLLLNTRNILGLSATPFAHDVNAILLYNTIGNILFVAKNYITKPKTIYYIKYNSGLSLKYAKRMAFFAADYVKGVAFYNSIIKDNSFYLQVIVDAAISCLKNKHKLLILASTVEQVENIIQKLQEAGLNPVPVYSKASTVNKGVDDLLVGTFKFASTGFDYDELSALLLALPLKGKTSLIQSIGRIVRYHPTKLPPIVIDLIDMAFPSLFEKNIGTKIKVISNEFQVNEGSFNTITWKPKPGNFDNDDI
jgi:superfamily II DNA or RNA helicase